MTATAAMENNWSEHPELLRTIRWALADKEERSPKNWVVYRAGVDGATWTVRMNDFPTEPLYTLLIGGEPRIDFNNWPALWHRPDHEPE